MKGIAKVLGALALFGTATMFAQTTQSAPPPIVKKGSGGVATAPAATKPDMKSAPMVKKATADKPVKKKKAKKAVKKAATK